MIKRILKYILFINKERLVKVYSHPRSGTHFLEAFLAKNFYQNKNLSINEIKWGHWSNRKIKIDGNIYGKLFGSHFFSESIRENEPAIYIFRDGRAVAYSVWNTPNFLHKDMNGITFKEFIRMKLDWYGSPAKKTSKEYTIFEHWALHVDCWLEAEKENKNILVIKYEDLIKNPFEVYLKIHNKFFGNKKKLNSNQIDVIKKPVGLLPNKATADSWREVFDKDDEEYFLNCISNSSAFCEQFK